MKIMANYLVICGAVAIGMLALMGIPAQAAEFGELILSTGVIMDYFTDDSSRENEGTEITVPFSLSYQKGWFSLNFSTGYASVTLDPLGELDPVEALSSKISSLVDSLLSSSYTFPDLPIGALTVGADMNLPTGKASLGALEWDSEAGENHDLLTVEDFGEGWNMGLSLGLIRELGPLMAGVNTGYVYKGTFDPTTDEENDEFDPGDQFLLTTLLNWEPSERLTFDTTLVYTHTEPDTVDGQQTFQEGDRISLSGSMNFEYTEQVGIAVNLQQEIQLKNKEGVGGDLETEPSNGNSNTFSGGVFLNYDLSEAFSLEARTDLRYYSESKRYNAALELPWEGRRIRYAFGGGPSYRLNEYLSFSGSAEWFRMHEDGDVDRQEDVTSTGVNLNIGATCVF